jgi:hypothetical protein
MKKITFLIATVLLANFANAQLTNLGFENWTNDEPDGWWSFDQLAPIDMCVQETDAHSGNYAVKVQTVDFAGQTSAGAFGLTNFTEDETESGIPYTLRPTEFSFWAKYSTAGDDSVLVVAQLTKWNGAEAIVVGEAGEILKGTGSTYTQYTPQFTYTSSDTPDSLQIIVLVAQPELGIATLGSYVILDDFEIDATVTPGVPNAPTNLTATALKTALNDGIRLTWTDNSNDETGFVFERATDVNGPYTQIGTTGPDATVYDDLTTSDGTTYFYKVYAENGNGTSAASNVADATASGVVGIEKTIEATVKMYPNPSNGNFTIQLPAVLENSKVSVLNITGQEVYSANIIDNAAVNLNVAAGNYFLKIQHEKYTINKRIVVE